MPVLDYFLHVCTSQANIVLLHLERNDFLCVLPCSLNQLTIRAHHCFKGWNFVPHSLRNNFGNNKGL